MTLHPAVSDPRPAPTGSAVLTLVGTSRPAAEPDREPPAPRAVTRLHGRELRRLVAGAADGDETCWERLVERLTPLVCSVARSHRLSPSDTEDVCQATWCALVAHVSTLRDPERLPGWLATTARRESLRALDRARRQVPHGDDLPEPQFAEPSVDEHLLRHERDAALWAAVGRLRHSDQRLLHLLVAREDAAREPSYREIADTLGVAVGSVGPTRGRALQRLRTLLPDPEVLRPAAA